MPSIGPAEILVILLVALLVFGPEKLPEIGRQIGRATREFRRVQATLREEVRDVLEPRVLPPAAPPAGSTPEAGSAEVDAATEAPGAEPHDPELPVGDEPPRADPQAD